MALFTLILCLLTLFLLLFFLWKMAEQTRRQEEAWESLADNLSDQLTYQLDLVQKNLSLEQSQALNRLQVDLYQNLTEVRQTLHEGLHQSRDRAEQSLSTLDQRLTQSLKDLQLSNEQRLEEMRQTVSEKLDKTLNQRLQTSFETVSKQLESVNQGLGQMQAVAKDVGTLNKVLSNTKTRGILGELQLGQIIEDILTSSQYEREIPTISGSSERVEYAIKLPGQSPGQQVYLPIDSKFPLEDYYRLEEAYELGDKEAVDLSRKALLAAIKRFAKDIRTKYVNPPETTNFGILFLPTEGLYAEVVRQAAFFDSLRREEQIIIAGPSTLSAILNSLAVGFKTLSIQQNAADIGQILGNVKTEFGKFSGLLSKTQRQLQTASRSLDSLMTTRTTAIVRALDKIEQDKDQAKLDLLGLPPLEEEK